MALNRSPLTAVTDADAETYARDGAVCLRNVFDPEWIAVLREEAERIAVKKEDVGLLPTYPGRYLARVMPGFRRFLWDSPVAEAAGRAMRSNEIRFFFDELFVKEPRSTSGTIWHTDRMGWPTTGVMVPSLWIPLGPVKPENCLEVVLGSHTQDVRYWLFSPNARQMIKPDDRAPHPDVEKHRGDPDWRFHTWEMDVGDMLIVHPWTLHQSTGNTDDDWRIALSVRVFGDDIRWKPRPDCVNLAGVSFDEMLEGERPGGSHFPLLWSADGRQDDDSAYPRGFATAWSSARKEAVNEDKVFQTLAKKALAEQA